MKITTRPRTARLLALGIAALFAPSWSSALIVNGGFESGLTGWVRADQVGSEGTFVVQSGTSSPVNGFTVPAPPGGTSAAMTDAFGPGSHVLYQDFVVPLGGSGYQIGFSLFVNNGNGAPGFFTPNTLDFATPALNQRARVDILRVTADPFTLAAGDILQNLFQTNVGDPLVSGYTSRQVDISAILQANQGQTLRLRFAEVDNVAPFNFGVDNVAIQATAATVADGLPAVYAWLAMAGLLALHQLRSRRQRAP